MAFAPGDSVIFCFGEIDVRCHIKKQSLERHCDPETVIDELARDYLTLLKK